MKDRVRSILKQLDEISPFVEEMEDDASLYDIGLSSFGAVELMVALENDFGIRFPDTMLTRETFESISSISEAMITLQGRDQAGERQAGLEVISLGPASARGGDR